MKTNSTKQSEAKLSYYDANGFLADVRLFNLRRDVVRGEEVWRGDEKIRGAMVARTIPLNIVVTIQRYED